MLYKMLITEKIKSNMRCIETVTGMKEMLEMPDKE